MLQDCKGSPHLNALETVQSTAFTQPELRLAESLSDLHHARELIDELKAQLEESERTAADKHSTITRKLEYTERVFTSRAC